MKKLTSLVLATGMVLSFFMFQLIICWTMISVKSHFPINQRLKNQSTIFSPIFTAYLILLKKNC